MVDTMIPILYEEQEKLFQSNGIGRLSDARSCIVKEQENSGEYELEMEYPFNGVHADELQASRIISAKPYDGADHRQAFRIYKIVKKAKGMYQVSAHHITYQKAYIPIIPGGTNAMSCKQAFQMIPQWAAEPFPFTLYTDIDSSEPFGIDRPMSLGTLLMDEWKGKKWDDEVDEYTNEEEIKGGIQKIYGGVFEWDNWTIKLLASRGRDNNIEIRYGKNLVDLTQEEDIGEITTGVIPYWLDSEDKNMKTYLGPSGNQEFSPIYTDYVNDYPYHRTAVLDMSSMFNSEDYVENEDEAPTSQQIYDRAKKYMADNHIGEPNVNLEISFQQLADTEEYKNIAPLEHVQLCDTVYVYFEKFGIHKKARVVAYEYDVLHEKYNTITLDKYKDTFIDKITGTITRRSQDASTDLANASKQLTNDFNKATTDLKTELTGQYNGLRSDFDDYTTSQAWLDNAKGYVVPTIDNGRWIALNFLNAMSEGNATRKIVINNGGIGFSTRDSVGNAWGTINQAWTMGGVLGLGGVNNKTGRLVIYDSSGNEIGHWDKDGIKATTGTFSGTLSAATGSFEGAITATSGTIGGITIGDSSLYAQGSEGRFSLNTDGSITHSSTGSDTITNMHAGNVYVSDASNSSILSPSGIVTPSGIFGKWNSSNGEEAGISITGDIWLNGTKLDLSSAGQVPHSRELRMDYGPEIVDGYSDFGDYDVRATKYGDLVSIGRYHVIGYDWMQGWITEGSNSSFDSLRSRVTALENGGGGSSSSSTINIGVTRNEKESLYFGNSFWSASYIFGGDNSISYNTYHVYLNESSDERLKNIDDIHGDISKFYMGLKPIEFEYKPGLYDRKEPIKFYGFSAQNIETALNNAGFEPCNRRIVYDTKPDEEAGETQYIDSDDTVKYIQKEELHAFHVAMIQQQEHRIEELEKENADLKARLEKLESIIFAKA